MYHDSYQVNVLRPSGDGYATERVSDPTAVADTIRRWRAGLRATNGWTPSFVVLLIAHAGGTRDVTHLFEV